MANVCSVPLSYLLSTYGQGVKIFSLVSQQCRKENFLIPQLNVNVKKYLTYHEQPSGFEYGEEENAEVLNNDDGYEGANRIKTLAWNLSYRTYDSLGLCFTFILLQ